MIISDRKIWFQSREDLNFPRHFQFRDGRLAASFTQGRHTVYERTCFMMSEDEGETWLPDDAYPFDHHIHFISRLNDATLLTWGESGIQTPERGFKQCFEAATSRDEGRSWAIMRMPVEGRFSRLTQFNRLIMLADGTLLQGAYGNRKGGEQGRRVYLMACTPGETWWRLRSVVFNPGPEDAWKEGATENAIEQLPDGRLVCVARTGYPDSPLVQSWSDDDGLTWSPPVVLAHGGVCPQLQYMGNGKLLLVFGNRRENKIDGALTALCSTDGGVTWSAPFILYDGPGSQYSCITPIDNHRCLISYAESRFIVKTLPQHVDSNALNKICAVVLECS